MDAIDAATEKRPFSERMLDGVRRLGNKVPHPVMMFVYLIIFIVVLSHILYWFDVTVTEEIAVPVPTEEQMDAHGGLGGSDVPYETPVWATSNPSTRSRPRRSRSEPPRRSTGLRFIFTSFVNNFAGFSVVAVIFVAMVGVGVAEHAGLMAALIRKLVTVAPRRLIAFILIFVGVLSSVASDAGYLILIPLGCRFHHPGESSPGRDGGRLRRGRRDLRGQPAHHADRQHDHRDHQRGDPSRGRASHRHRQLLLLGGLERRPRSRRHVRHPASWRRDSAPTTPGSRADYGHDEDLDARRPRRGGCALPSTGCSAPWR